MGDTTQSLQFSNDRPTAVTLVDKNGNALTSLGGGSGGTTNNNTTNNNNYNTTNNNTTNNASTGAVTLLDALSNPYGARNPVASKIVDPYYADRILQIGVDGSMSANVKDLFYNALSVGQMFTATPGAATTTGIVAGTLNTVGAMQVFNPSASKRNVLIISVQPQYIGANAISNINAITADQGYGGAANVSNCSLGSAVASVCTVSYANNGPALAGKTVATVQTGTGMGTYLTQPSFFYLLPAGAANGLVFYCNITTAGNWSCCFKWLEF